MNPGDEILKAAIQPLNNFAAFIIGHKRLRTKTMTMYHQPSIMVVAFFAAVAALLLQTNVHHVLAATKNKHEACADMDTLEAAETACTALHDCGALEDTNFGSDCTGNKEEHCAEIAACSQCEAEIRAMFECEHGVKCGGGLGSCSAEDGNYYNDDIDDDPAGDDDDVDDDKDATAGDDDDDDDDKDATAGDDDDDDDDKDATADGDDDDDDDDKDATAPAPTPASSTDAAPTPSSTSSDAAPTPSSSSTDASGDSASGVPTATMAPSSSSRRSIAFAATITIVLAVAAGPYLL